ncbi:hypothetical protein [Metabacillus fastidiosus]|uniref:hypothetical protein n=1 Tax=Metabacillus fastidiosus TaxID=1458 RepID=UPI002DBB18C4|nr:hypothetical protein [Metabacillus fastidiosus]MEC2075052.1 hypothetical protein [Metabacillus fastidiosus]
MKKNREVDRISLYYLNLQTPKENRGNIIVFFLITLDLIGVLPILAYPFSYKFFIAMIIPVAFLHIWAIMYVIAPYKYKRSYYLFFGIYGLINTYVYFLVIQKLLYSHLLIQGSTTFILGIIFFIALIIFINGLNIRFLYSGTYAKLQANKTSKNMGPITAAAGLGYVIAQLVLTFIYSVSIKMAVIIIAISILSIVTAYFSIFIHRYFFILKNKDIVKKVNPEFGLPKKLRSNM